MKQKKPGKIHFMLASPDQVCSGMGAHCEAHRISKQLTRDDVAKKAGISERTVARFELTGKADLATFIRILQALGLVDRLSALQFNTERPSPLQMLELSGVGGLSSGALGLPAVRDGSASQQHPVKGTI